MSRFMWGTLIAVVTVTFLSTTSIFINHLTDFCYIPPLLLAFWRDTAHPGYPPPAPGGAPPLGLFLLYGLDLAVFNAVWTLSVVFNGAAIFLLLNKRRPAEPGRCLLMSRKERLL